jgi:hypothetical protein
MPAVGFGTLIPDLAKTKHGGTQRRARIHSPTD